MITHLEPNILECEVKWALESITTNKIRGGDGIPAELLHFYFLSLFFGIGTKTDLYSPVATAEFSKFAGILSAALSQHHLLGFEIA